MTERHAADPSCNSLVRLCSDNPDARFCGQFMSEVSPQAAGENCTVACAAGYAGESPAVFVCGAQNTAPTTEPSGILPSCAAVTGCAALEDQGNRYDESNCNSLAAGAECTVGCASGYGCPPVSWLELILVR